MIYPGACISISNTKWDCFWECRLRLIFNFPIVNFPFLSSNIPSAPAYGIYVSQLIRYARAYSNYQDFMKSLKVLRTKLLSQGYQKTKLVATLKNYYGRLLNPDNVAVSRIVSGCFCQWRGISRLPKSRTYASTLFPSFRPMGMVGEACLPSNAYYPRIYEFGLWLAYHDRNYFQWTMS